MKRYLLQVIVSTILSTTTCVTGFSQTVENPVIRDYIYHESSLIDGKDGYFYSFVSSIFPRDSTNFKLYYTVSIFRSSDLEEWKFFKYALSSKDIQQRFLGNYDKTHRLAGKFALRGKKNEIKYYPIWAPDVIRYKDRYLLFVALRKSSDDTKMAVFEANSLSEDFRFVNVIVSNCPEDKEAYFPSREQIDPFPIVDGDDFYLVFGSFVNASNGKTLDSRKGMGVYMVRLDPSQGFKMKEHPHFITNNYEGVIILKHNKAYYLLGSNGSIRNYTYKVSYAKSMTIEGPYLNEDGKSIADTLNINFGTTILQTYKDSRFNGFGCPSLPVKDKEGRLWMLVFGHAPEYAPINSNDAAKERYTFLLEFQWDRKGNPFFDVNAIERNSQRKPVL